jgi:hypothetical protein
LHLRLLLLLPATALKILLTLDAPSAWVLYSKAGETAASKLMLVK